VNGINYLLDTNFILGLLKSTPEAMALIEDRNMNVQQCAYSAISRMELLGYSAITNAEESLIQDKLMRLTYLPITSMVENVAIRLRRTRRVKLPDAIIVATALEAGVELITFDYQLQSLMADELTGRPVNAG
jgi:predicted nucleic acid-binding protein